VLSSRTQYVIPVIKMGKYIFELRVSVEADDIEETRLIAIGRTLDALNDPEVLGLMEIEGGEEE